MPQCLSGPLSSQKLVQVCKKEAIDSEKKAAEYYQQMIRNQENCQKLKSPKTNQGSDLEVSAAHPKTKSRMLKPQMLRNSDHQQEQRQMLQYLPHLNQNRAGLQVVFAEGPCLQLPTHLMGESLV